MRILGFSGLDGGVCFMQRCFPDHSAREHRIVQGLDSAAVLLHGGTVEFAAAEERFSREKTTGAFPVHAMRACFAHAGIEPADVDFVAHGFDYGGLRPLFEHDAIAAALHDAVYAPDRQLRLLEQHFPGGDWSTRLIAVPHHLAHAASAFHQSGFRESLILVSDAMGETHSATVLAGSGSAMEILAQIPALHSLGVLYGVFTLYLGFQFNMDEYKVMGLAPYGDARRYFAEIMEMVQLDADGTYVIPIFSEDRSLEDRFTYRGVLRVLTERLGPPRDPDAAIDQRCRDIAAGLQAVLHACQLHVLRHFRRATGLKTLCLAGGVTLNCTANGVIHRSRVFRDVFVQPAAGDDGTALGAALYVQRAREPRTPPSRIALPLWGPEYEATEIADALAGRDDCVTVHFDDFDALAREAARRLSDGQILAWFQGRMEFGPRALGSRSILADPRRREMRDRINSLVKKREGFRPFAPAVVADAAARYFEIERGEEDSYAHMLFAMPVREEYRDRLPAITHVDGSARLQTVTRDGHPRFWSVLNEFGRLTGIPMLLNTSFNVRGQPIVCSPDEAIDTFLVAGLDALVIGDCLVTAAAA